MKETTKTLTVNWGTVLVVEWDGRTVRIPVSGFEPIVGAILTAPNDWGKIWLVDEGQEPSRVLLWCDGTTAAQRERGHVG